MRKVLFLTVILTLVTILGGCMQKNNSLGIHNGVYSLKEKMTPTVCDIIRIFTLLFLVR